MADNRQKPNWRGAAPHAKAGAAKATPGPKRAGGKQKFLLLFGMLGLVGMIVGLITLIRPTPKPLYLGIAVTEYSNPNWPPNPWGQQDSKAIESLPWDEGKQAFQAQERQKIIQELNALADRTAQSADKGRPIVVHFTSLAVVWDGKVYLLPGNAQPAEPNSWLPLEEVLAALRRGQGPRLLLLDVARPVADARLGILSDDVAAGVDAELAKAQKDGNLNFLVLTACKKGELSHGSWELRRSVFGYFVEQGARGLADGWDGNNPNAEIKALELVKYVQAQVANWAKNQALPAQTPTLYGNGDDFVVISPRKPYPTLALPERSEPPPEKDKPPDKDKAGDKDKDKPAEPKSDYPKWLADAWTIRDTWRENGSYRRAPRTYRHYEELLLRSERRWLAGDDAGVVEKAFTAEAAKLRAQLAGYLPGKIDPLSIAEARRRLTKAEETQVAGNLSTLLNRMSGPAPPTEMEVNEGLTPFLKMPPEPNPTEAMALAALNRVKEIADPSDAQLAAFKSLFDKILAPWPPPPPPDVLLVPYLVNMKKTQLERWADQKLMVKQLILQTGAIAEEAAVIDPRALPWVKAELDEAFKLRRDGLFSVSTGDSTERKAGRDNLEASAAKFRKILADARVLEEAFQRVDDAMVF